MASANVETVRGFYPTEPLEFKTVIEREDAVEFLEARFGDVFADDFETADSSGIVAPAARGMAGFVAGWREWLASFDSWSVAVDSFEESGDTVLVVLDIVARSSTGHVEMPTRAANVLTFRDGRVQRVELHTDIAQARLAAGLNEA